MNEANATLTRDLNVPSISGQGGHTVSAGTRVRATRDGSGMIVSGALVGATIYTETAAVKLDPPEDYYLVTVKDENGDTVNDQTFPVGTWQEIAYWLDGCGYIEPGYLIETRVVAGEVI